MILVIVSGPEASGKTYIAKELADRLGYYYLGKDVIKEKLFDEAPQNTWHSKWYESQAKDKMFAELGQHIKNNKSLVLESNFAPEDKQRLKELVTGKLQVAEVYCSAKGLVSFKRFVKRNESGRRHKGHHDRRLYLVIFIQNVLRVFHLDRHYKPLNLSSNVIRMDCTRLPDVDFEKIIRQIKKD